MRVEIVQCDGCGRKVEAPATYYTVTLKRMAVDRILAERLHKQGELCSDCASHLLAAKLSPVE